MREIGRVFKLFDHRCVHVRNLFFFLWQFPRITTENIDILTEIGILYLRINDTKGAFDKLFEVTKLHENCSKALLALGSILQV